MDEGKYVTAKRLKFWAGVNELSQNQGIPSLVNYKMNTLALFKNRTLLDYLMAFASQTKSVKYFS